MGQVAMQEILDLLHDYIIETERFCNGWWSWIVNPSSRQLDGGNLEMFFLCEKSTFFRFNAGDGMNLGRLK